MWTDFHVVSLPCIWWYMLDMAFGFILHHMLQRLQGKVMTGPSANLSFKDTELLDYLVAQGNKSYSVREGVTICSPCTAPLPLCWKLRSYIYLAGAWFRERLCVCVCVCWYSCFMLQKPFQTVPYYLCIISLVNFSFKHVLENRIYSFVLFL